MRIKELSQKEKNILRILGLALGELEMEGRERGNEKESTKGDISKDREKQWQLRPQEPGQLAGQESEGNRGVV